MFIRIRTLILIAVAAIGLWIAAAAYHVSCVWGARVSTNRHFHGLCNVGVGDPYRELIARLRQLHESGQTDKLGQALVIADTRSRDIYDVWLSEDYKKYRSSIREILR